MPDQKISQMDPAAALTGAELVPAVQSGGNVRTTTQGIANLVSLSSLGASANGITLIGHTFAQMRADLDLEAGTDFVAYSAYSANALTLIGHTFAQMRTDLSLVPGTDVQVYSAKLAALAAQTWAADTITYQTSTSAVSTTALTAFGRSLIDDADAATARTTLGLVIGTDVQAYDADTAKLDVAQTWSAVQAFTRTSAGAAQTPNVLRNASSTANTEVVLQLNPSASTARYTEIASRNDGSNALSLIFRTSNGGVLVDALTLSAAGAATFEGALKAASAELNSAFPIATFYDTSGTADNRRWQAWANSGFFYLQATNDANSVADTAISIGRSGAAVTDIYFGASIKPDTDGGASIGSTALKWANLHLAPGGVVNWNNGAFTLTQSGSTLTASGAVVTGGAVTAGGNITIAKNTPIFGLTDNASATTMFQFVLSSQYFLELAGTNRLSVDASNVNILNGGLTVPSNGIFLGGANNLATSIAIRSNAGYSRGIGFYTGASSLRWFIECDSTAESGGNAGSNFAISAWTDAGAFSSTPFSIARSTGIITTSAAIVAGGPINQKSYTVAGLPAGTAGDTAYASNGRKNGEGAGAGTGVLVFKDGTAWRACDTGATVAA